MTDPFQPSWRRAAWVIATAVAGFFIPQKVPLEYYPLNHPSSGLQYLEITCAANTTGETQMYLNYGHGFNRLDCIQLPIGPSKMAFTYTFPLRDAPLLGLRLDPFLNGPGELTVTSFSLINRRGEELRRFSADRFFDLHEIAKIAPVEAGWKFVVEKGAADPRAQVRFDRPAIPEGMNERNLKRCLLSTGYLALMLWIILLAVYFALRLFRNGRDVARACAFLLFIAAAFSVVGNRGLIRSSIDSAQKARSLHGSATVNVN